jgi:hypothetical protein
MESCAGDRIEARVLLPVEEGQEAGGRCTGNRTPGSGKATGTVPG